VGEAARAGVSAIELFCSRGHFDYRSADDARELASWLAGNNLTLHSIHSPTTRDFHPRGRAALPLSISDPERLRRQEAVDEIKRALDLVEHVPFRYCIQHVARHRAIFRTSAGGTPRSVRSNTCRFSRGTAASPWRLKTLRAKWPLPRT
jgi:sugar phosphate isomerase/epimerase